MASIDDRREHQISDVQRGLKRVESRENKKIATDLLGLKETFLLISVLTDDETTLALRKIFEEHIGVMRREAEKVMGTIKTSDT